MSFAFLPSFRPSLASFASWAPEPAFHLPLRSPLPPARPLTSRSSDNADVYLGYVGWAAGAFDPSYVLSEVPIQNGDSWTDTPLFAACIAR